MNLFVHAMRHTVLFVFAAAFLVPCSIAQAQVEGVRVLPERGYFPGVAVAVEIEVPPHDEALTVTETPPAGWEIVFVHTDSVRSGGAVENGSITWSVRDRTLAVSLRYVAVPPPDAAGEAAFAGAIDGVPIAGAASLGEERPSRWASSRTTWMSTTCRPGMRNMTRRRVNTW